MSVWALLVAAGAGERLGEERPKAFVRLGELPLLAEPLRRLEESGWVDAIVIAVPAGWEEPAILLAEELSATKVVAAVTGGATRADSVRIALAEVPEDAVVALVHDAARPLLPDEVIERVLAPLSEGWDGVVPGLELPDTVKRVRDGAVVETVDRKGGVVPGLELPDTVKRVRDGAVVETVDRKGLYGVQTPQAFLAPALRRAFERLCVSETQGAPTDCAAVVEADGGRIKLVEGDSRLLKVTTRADLELVASWL